MNKIDKEYKNFKITRIVHLEELQAQLIETIHLPTQATILHIYNDDPENVFSLAFKTYPQSSDGAPHILEHTVLCGSEKFPVKDPFFSMNRRSLNTFMNAMTGSDFTCYPAASQNPQDFYNLLDVYIDAAFFPKLDLLSFTQEGHRLEYLDINNPTPEALLRKGIVYNEMKGVQTAPDSRLNDILMSTLFPDSPYGYSSGGDPKVIPSLTYQGLKEYHNYYYHPSRCLFYFYGNLPTTSHLDFLEENLLNKVEYAPPIPPLTPQPYFSAPKKISSKYPSNEDEGEDKVLLGMSWLTSSILEQTDILALEVLDIALMGTDAAPLKMELLKSGLCKQAGMFLDNELLQVPLTLIIKGCSPDNIDDIEKLVFKKFEEISEVGLDENLISSAIHQLELSRTEIDGDHYPFGLKLFFRSALLKMHGGEPEDGLLVHALFSKLREKLKNKSFLPELIKKYILNNPHYVRAHLEPDNNMEKVEANQEKEALIEIAKKLNPEEVKNICSTAKQLSELQEKEENKELDILPTITIKDISESPIKVELTNSFRDDIKINYNNSFTNSFTYAKISYLLPMVQKEEIPLTRLFSLFLPLVGCGSRNYIQNLEYLLQYTGGTFCNLSINHQAQNYKNFTPSISMGGKSLSRNSDKLFNLIKDTIEKADFSDTERLGQLLMQHHSSLENGLNSNTLKYATKLACRSLGASSYLANQWYGLDYLYFIRETIKQFDKSPKELSEKLQAMHSSIFGRSKPQIVITADEHTYSTLENQNFYGLTEVPYKDFQPWSVDYPNLLCCHNQGKTISSSVAFTAQAFNTVSYTHPDAALLSIASFNFKNRTLHKRIREQGGAYGGGASNNHTSGKFYFYAYRDPKIATTIQAFREALLEVSKGNFDSDDIQAAQFEMMQTLDSPIPPGSRATTAYAWELENKTYNDRCNFRSNLLKATKENIQNAVNTHLIPQIETAPIVSFASKDMLKKENKILEHLNLQTFEISKI